MNQEGRPNIIFIMLDTLRADALKMYGGDAYLDNIERIGRTGTIYENAIAPGTYTGTSHSSMFQGKRVKSIKGLMKDKMAHYNRHIDPLLRKSKLINEGTTTLAKHMSYLGYKTALFSNNPLVTEYTGIAEGFSYASYSDNVFIGHPHRGRKKPFVNTVLGMIDNDVVRNRLIELSYVLTRPISKNRLDRIYLGLRTKLNKRLSKELKYYELDLGAAQARTMVNDYLKSSGPDEKFMYINYMEAHEGYPTNLVTKDYVEQEKWFYLTGMIDEAPVQIIKEACNKRLPYLDAQLGKMMDTLKKHGALDNAVVVIGSDHGQGFMEHKQMYHNMFPYNELVHVPLITARFVNGRQVKENEVVHNNVSMTRLYDSLLDIAYGKNDIVNGSMRMDNYVFADHNGISEVWDTYLLHLFKDRSDVANKILKAKVHHNTFATAVYHGKYKLIHYAGNKLAPELYDMRADPLETENIIGEKREVALDLVRADRKSS